MKHIRAYENIENRPKVGDYVIMNSVEKFKDYVNTHIGQIIRITYDSHIRETVQEYMVIYTDVPQYIEDVEKEKEEDLDFIRIKRKPYTWIKNFKPMRLIEFDNNKEKLELLLHANKYNL